MSTLINHSTLTCRQLLELYGNNEKLYADTIPGRLYRIKKTQIEMMRDRNYKIYIPDGYEFPIDEETEDKILNMSLLDFMNFYCDRVDSINENKPLSEHIDFIESLNSMYITPDEYRIMAYYAPVLSPLNNKFKDTKKYVITSINGYIENDEYDRALVISIQGYTSGAKSETLTYNNRFELFVYNELIINVTKHMLQPHFELMSDATHFLEHNNLKLKQLPRISFEDPIVRYYKAPIGSIFKIVRLIKHGTYITYRVVSVVPLLPKSPIPIV